MLNRLGSTRSVVKPSYALLAPDGHVTSVLPGWSGCRVVVMISAAMGARFSQYLITFDDSGGAAGDSDADEWFFFLVSGGATINGSALSKGGFAYVAPANRFRIERPAPQTALLAFRKLYEAPPAGPSPSSFSGHEDRIAEAPLLDDPHTRLKVLIPDAPTADMAVNILTYDPGATLPFVETHVMEHGLLFLQGGGVYRLGDDWHPVAAGDAIWIASYCPQWFVAAGPEPARYIYYKDVNRLPA